MVYNGALREHTICILFQQKRKGVVSFGLSALNVEKCGDRECRVQSVVATVKGV